ncbi:MAG TPA: ATP-binding protein [Pyrinomonadaceae bacterium]|nr:ATP-binding protein [Pyrinomonadaceae bacterium]
MPNLETVRIFSDAQAIQSERASDFDVYSAFGEVIDNSIEAEATSIRIKIAHAVVAQRGPSFQHLESVAFGDDGTGMTPAELHHCLQLGFSSRYGSRKGIGRFGVGMTKGAISQCKRIDVYSKKQSDKDWLYTCFDIEDIENNGEALIPAPVAKQLPVEFSPLVGTDCGTLVIWSKFDRQEASANKIIEEARIWIGRTFRKFIFDGIRLYLDGVEIKAIDPLYLRPEFTAFPEDPPAKEWGEPDHLMWTIDDPDILRNGGPTQSKIVIRHSLLPEEFRARGGGRTKAGNDPENVIRSINRNEGISILRNDREVRDPNFDIPYWKPKFVEVDRWWGCEISFDAVLDNWFQVKNVKRGAAPLKELREALEEKINHIRNSVRKEVQKYWDSLETPAPPPPGIEIDPSHGVSTRIAEVTVEDTKPIDNLAKDKEPEDEIEKFVKDRYGDIAPDKAKAFVEYFKQNKITILDTASNSPNFFESTHFGDGKHNVTYNTNHVFSKKYLEIIEALKAGVDDESITREQFMILIDLLLVAYSIAESQFDPNAQHKAEDFLEDMMIGWGRSLKSLMKTWAEYESR